MFKKEKSKKKKNWKFSNTDQFRGIHVIIQMHLEWVFLELARVEEEEEGRVLVLITCSYL